MAPLLLVTSTGRASRHLISTLLSLPECPAIRVIARSNSNIQEHFPPQLRSAPHSIVVADHFQGREFESAFRGVSIIFHNGPAVHAQEEAMSLAVIDAAKEAGIKHFVLCSVFHPMRTKLQTHKVKLGCAIHISHEDAPEHVLALRSTLWSHA
jgi:nucleoside-diphosphate-sugar epimerase